MLLTQAQIVHVPTFEAQYNALKMLVEQGRTEEIDPAWLSLHFMVIPIAQALVAEC